MGDPKDTYKFYKSNMANLDKSLNMKKQEKEREEPTREISVPVRIKSEHKDDWMKDLNVSIKVNKISQTRQIIDIQLTDDSDPQVLYSVEIGDQEFHTLKQEQSLLIEFQQFPQKFLEMLEYCNYEKYDKIDDNMSHRSSISSYGCVLHVTNISEALLIIQEATQFRQLNHLILKLKSASDSDLKNHLSEIVKEYKTRNENYQEENNKLNSLLDKNSIDQKNLKDELMFINEKQ
jgi:spindle assembly abnormal protein 6